MTTHESPEPEGPLDNLGRQLSMPDAPEGRELEQMQYDWSRQHDSLRDPAERTQHHVIGGTAACSAIVEHRTMAQSFVTTWLRRLADDLSSGRLILPLDDELLQVAQPALRFALECNSEGISLLLEWQAANEPPSALLRKSPRQAAVLRDLGRVTSELRGSGVLADESPDVAQALIDFEQSLRTLSSLSLAHVPDHLRVSRDDLLEWVDSTTGEDLPELVRQLVVETATGLEHVHFPTGTGVASAGWDGVTEAVGSSLFVPAGVAVWELSIRKDSNAKAEEDLAKRFEGARGRAADDTTYVAVICRPWTGSSAFAEAHSAEGHWKAVRALNVDDLETWLAQAPQTTAWLAERRHRPITGVQTSDAWWTQWLQSTEPPIAESLVLAGRASESATLLERILVPGVTTIGGDVRVDEVRAFVAATLAGSPEPKPHALFLSDTDDARRLLSRPGRLIALVPNGGLLAGAALDDGHHVIVPSPGRASADIALPPIAPEPVRDALEALGMLHRDASDNATLARRSLLALRRKLAKLPALYAPSWAAPGADLITRRAILVSMWNQSFSGDAEIISRLMSTTYSGVEESLRAAAAVPDSPMVAILDERWYVISPVDTWMLLAPQLTTADLEAFRDVVLEVLLDVDPREGLSESERLVASLDGVRVRYSGDLKRGLARSLGLLGALGDAVRIGSRTGEQFAGSIVWQLLQAANSDASSATWRRLAPHLPLIGEAAPDVLLNELRRALSDGRPLAQDVFADKARTQFGSPAPSPHTHVLWALENLAWSPTHFDNAVDLLAMLAELDPGGEWANRPAASLASIFCPWHPNTSANFEQRTATLTRLREQRPTVAWELLFTMLPESRGFHTIHQGPEFQDWKHSEPVVMQSEYIQCVRIVSSAIVDDASQDKERWIRVVQSLSNFPHEERARAIEQFRALAATGQLSDGTEDLWSVVRKLVTHHMEYADAYWALPAEVLESLDEVAQTLAPVASQNRLAWLFAEQYVELGDVRRRDDFDEYDRLIAIRRTEAVAQVLAEGGAEGLLEFARDSGVPGQVGAAAARVKDVDLLVEAASSLESADQRAIEFGWGYLTQKFQQQGWPWLDGILQSGLLQTPAGIARLLRLTFDLPVAIQRADELGENVSAEYWRDFTYFGLGADLKDVVLYGSRLVAAGRPAAALDLLALYSRQDPDVGHATAVLSAFEALMEHPEDPELRQLSQHDIQLLLNLLARFRDEVGVDRVVRIEWYFLPLLGFDPDAPTLHRTLADDPRLFADMVAKIYRPKSSDAADDAVRTDLDRQQAENSYRLLSSWHLCPGTDDNGLVDFGSLSSWVASARALLAEADRSDVGDQQIGQALAAAPSGADGVWPSEAVRRLLEDLRSTEIERGIEIRTYNNRGATSRGLSDGGTQEWALAASYNANASLMQSEWPRTASLMRRLAETYEADARREDVQAERWRSGLDR